MKMRQLQDSGDTGPEEAAASKSAGHEEAIEDRTAN